MSFALTASARPGQSRSPRIRVMPKKTRIGLQLAGSAAERASQSGSSGRDRRISMTRRIEAVDPAADIAGEAAERQADDEGDEDAHQARP